MASPSLVDTKQPETDLQDAIHLGPIGSSNSVKFKELIVNNASPFNLCILRPGQEEAIYYVNNSTFTPRTPDVTLYAGPNKSGPVIGVAHITNIWTSKIGLGDPASNISSMVWEDLARPNKWKHNIHKFESLFGEEGRKTFVWKRTKGNIFDDQGDRVLYEEGKEDVILAKYIGVGVFKWKKRGRLYMVEGGGDTWELMVLLTALALIELSRRRARQRRSSAHGGP
jgi:hypothetical protein